MTFKVCDQPRRSYLLAITKGKSLLRNSKYCQIDQSPSFTNNRWVECVGDYLLTPKNCKRYPKFGKCPKLRQLTVRCIKGGLIVLTLERTHEEKLNDFIWIVESGIAWSECVENALGTAIAGTVALSGAGLEGGAEGFYSNNSSPNFAFSINRFRVFDFLIAISALLFLLPVILLVALMICLFDSGPIIYAHYRVGHEGKMFPCLKFRTMAIDSQARLRHLLDTDPDAREEWIATRKLRVDPRITPLGQFLRKSSLDEIPQLVNVLRGEMSIVGPRPVVVEEMPLYGTAARHYLSVRPGITGLWQISGRNNISFRRRVALDVLYVRRKHLLFDIKILALTIPAVLMARGSY